MDSTIKITVLDDNHAVRKSLIQLLNILGHETDDFCTVTPFLSSLDNANPDVVILDQMLNDTRTGIELVPDIRKSLKDVPVLIISGFPDPMLHAEISRKQNVSFLAKPFAVTQLKETLSQILG
jgi:DNA-binding NtrC family response regulator